MSDEQEKRLEEQQAAELADYLEGGQGVLEPGDAEAIAVLQQAADSPVQIDDAKALSLWSRIVEQSSEQKQGRWPLVAYFAAAAAALLLLLYPAVPDPLPPGPEVADYDKAIKALDPAFGHPGQRLQAFDDLARKSRQRLISEMQR